MGFREIIEAGKKERDTSVLFGEGEYRSKVQEIVGAGGRNSSFRSHAFDEEIDKIGKDLNEKIKNVSFKDAADKKTYVNDTLDQIKVSLVYNLHNARDLAHVTKLESEIATSIEGAVDRALSKMSWSADSAQALEEKAAARISAYDYAIETIADKVIGKGHGRTSSIR